MPFIMIVPAEDDGGSSAIILFAGQHVFRFVLPAMGDSMNAYSGLSLGEQDEFGDSKLSSFFEVARERFPLEGVDPVMLEFSQMAFAQITQGIHW